MFLDIVKLLMRNLNETKIIARWKKISLPRTLRFIEDVGTWEGFRIKTAVEEV